MAENHKNLSFPSSGDQSLKSFTPRPSLPNSRGSRGRILPALLVAAQHSWACSCIPASLPGFPRCLCLFYEDTASRVQPHPGSLCPPGVSRALLAKGSLCWMFSHSWRGLGCNAVRLPQGHLVLSSCLLCPRQWSPNKAAV